MGLKDKLLNDGSTDSLLNGADGVTNPLVAGKGNGLASSTLHSDGTETKSYSLNGSDQSVVNTGYQAYDDDMPNALPPPSTYDLNGGKPSNSYDISGPPEGLIHI